jgi:hypothetical protein
MIPGKTQAPIDDNVMTLYTAFGRKVETFEAKIDGRDDWKVNAELTYGDSAQPLVVLVNGFIWPRENSAQFMEQMFNLNSATQDGPAYPTLRYDMSGQGKTIASFAKDGPEPWFVSEALTLEKLRHEMTEVVRTSLKRAGLPPNHPIVMIGLSYGRSVLAPELAKQTVLMVDMAGMKRAQDEYNPASAMWRNSLAMIRLNPWLIPAADQAQLNAWQLFYENFYIANPGRIPKDVVRSWYVASSAKRTNASEGYNADQHVFPGIPNLTLIAEVDDTALKLDQLRHFRDVQSKVAPSALFYFRKVGHGMVIDYRASGRVVDLMNKVVHQHYDLTKFNDRVYEVIFGEDGSWTIRPISLDALVAENSSKSGKPAPQQGEPQ